MTCSSDTTIKLWNVAHEKCLATLTEHADYVKALAYASHRSVITGRRLGGGGGTCGGWGMLGTSFPFAVVWRVACAFSTRRPASSGGGRQGRVLTMAGMLSTQGSIGISRA